jgi:N-acetylmuramoyl-L-alanine amidase
VTITTRLSPHRQPRKAASRITSVILHDTGGKTAESTLSWFEAPQSKVSSHYLVGKDGRVWLCVPEEQRAWHAGISENELWGEEDLNETSIGIELVDNNDADPYPDPQVVSLIELLADVCWRHKIPLHRVVGHQHIARPRGRKSDPGRDFDWFRVLAAVGAHVALRLEAER